MLSLTLYVVEIIRRRARMRKIAIWLSAISFFVFVIDWGVIGLKIFEGDYDITVGVYLGLISLIVLLVCLLYLRLTNRCPHCGRRIQTQGRYCPCCGKEIDV